MFLRHPVILRQTCVPVGNIYRHQIFLEVQIVISIRIKYTENMRGDLGGVTYRRQTHKESGGGYFYLRGIFSRRELSDEVLRACHSDIHRETWRKEADRFCWSWPAEPLEPGDHLILRELCPLLTEEHVVGPEIAPSVHVLGCQLQQEDL